MTDIIIAIALIAAYQQRSRLTPKQRRAALELWAQWRGLSIPASVWRGGVTPVDPLESLIDTPLVHGGYSMGEGQ